MLNDVDELILPRQWLAWQTTYGYVDNVAAAIEQVIDHSGTQGEVFNLAERNPCSQSVWADKIAEVMQWHGLIRTSDAPDLPFARQLQGLDLTVPFKVSGAKLHGVLGRYEVLSNAAALDRTVAVEVASIRGSSRGQ